jgi:tetratricopeptide (TPR) repeat protein
MLNQEWNPELADLALGCVGSHVPDQKYQKYWSTQRRLLRHANRCWGFISDGRLHDENKEWALHRFGNLYSDQGRYKEAGAMYQRALQGYERVIGPEHTSTLTIVNNLGNLHKKLGRLDEAEKIYRRVHNDS